MPSGVSLCSYQCIQFFLLQKEEFFFFKRSLVSAGWDKVNSNQELDLVTDEIMAEEHAMTCEIRMWRAQDALVFVSVAVGVCIDQPWGCMTSYFDKDVIKHDKDSILNLWLYWFTAGVHTNPIPPASFCPESFFRNAFRNTEDQFHYISKKPLRNYLFFLYFWSVKCYYFFQV